jgi:DNA-binding response OmpR family regulator
VDAVFNGVDALDYGMTGNYELLILDVMMPGLNGIEVVTKLRKNNINSPVLILTAKSQIEDRIVGLDAGADDYLCKPFAMGELLARVRAMSRRKSEYTPNIISLGNISLNKESYELYSGNNALRLGNKEFQMMELLMTNPKCIISTEQFMERIWGYDAEAEINVVWVYISYLRRKLEALGADIKIKAIRGVGYSLEENE